MKQRFSSLDLKAAAAEINAKLQDTRLANIYDLSSRTFLLKFQKNAIKHNVVIDPGYRVHTTAFARETFAQPSNFCAKLRKHVRTRRITHVKQLGSDRVLIFTFGGGENNADPDRSSHLLVEFYAGGNVILTDGHFKILALQRVVGEDEGQKVAVGETYDVGRRLGTEFDVISRERLLSALTVKEVSAAPEISGKATRKQKGAGTLKKVLTVSLSHYGAALVEHCILDAGLDPSAAATPDMADALQPAFEKADAIVQAPAHPGFIVTKMDGDHEVYDDFQPFLPLQVQRAGLKTLSYETFNDAVDAYFSSIESQKLDQRVRQQEATAAKKIAAVHDEHKRKIDGLVEAQTTSAQKAAALEGSQGIVDEAIAAVKLLLEQGMDWVDMEKMIRSEAKAGNPVASVIRLPLKLKENKITVSVPALDALYENEESETDEEDSPRELVVDVDLAHSAFANARNYYAVRRTAMTKEEKTQQSSKKALRSTQKKVENDLRKQLKEKTTIKPIRKIYWFEKFLWFISSEGYLVLGGHDAQQNEALYKKHFSQGDIYVHADLTGAATVIIKNTAADQPIPPTTLSQAGTLSVATSSAWDAKMVISAYWVNFDQVSKTAPTGEYLTTGSFMIRGKKNFLPPSKLELGYGMYFVVDETSRDRHIKLKAAKQEEDKQFDTAPKSFKAPAANTNAHEGYEDTTAATSSPPAESTLVSEIPETSGAASKDPADKYNLEEHGAIDEAPAPKSFSGKAQHTTAKQKRERRKGKSDVPDKAETRAPLPQQAQTPSKQEVKLTRGQKAKKKKLAKYADQDEDDKELAQQLLGIQIKSDHKSESEDESAARSKPASGPPKLKKEGSAAEVARILKDEKIPQLDEEEQDLITPLDILVPMPLSDDVLLDAIPTCAPYGALQKFKYKCKLQPGGAKKGKALKGVVAGWCSQPVDESSQDKERLWPREKELMKSLKDQEIISCVGVKAIKVSGLDKRPRK
ncbi:fibronectin-binding protein A N-terminus-domain-containing protein [Protomyces lactucae-debilis]|uniref:Ribosome quality control complex subunit 2 n=1 Tax=Protomyces lactucae-debilis TaxID=2754530 RepID=A0A1Y2FKA4_PROLT|nr:fibronectin-binding protein A N-terminus-domain-containing protein [Protomyces lactucae-debilis]ORY84369.1 fibronectin-binding protein A N-terminus-domain-containing protein [Protomyces lactucae-debilis]